MASRLLEHFVVGRSKISPSWGYGFDGLDRGAFSGVIYEGIELEKLLIFSPIIIGNSPYPTRTVPARFDGLDSLYLYLQGPSSRGGVPAR